MSCVRVYPNLIFSFDVVPLCIVSLYPGFGVRLQGEPPALLPVVSCTSRSVFRHGSKHLSNDECGIEKQIVLTGSGRSLASMAHNTRSYKLAFVFVVIQHCLGRW